MPKSATDSGTKSLQKQRSKLLTGDRYTDVVAKFKSNLSTYGIPLVEKAVKHPPWKIWLGSAYLQRLRELADLQSDFPQPGMPAPFMQPLHGTITEDDVLTTLNLIGKVEHRSVNLDLGTKNHERLHMAATYCTDYKAKNGALHHAIHNLRVESATITSLIYNNRRTVFPSYRKQYPGEKRGRKTTNQSAIEEEVVALSQSGDDVDRRRLPQYKLEEKVKWHWALTACNMACLQLLWKLMEYHLPAIDFANVRIELGINAHTMSKLKDSNQYLLVHTWTRSDLTDPLDESGLESYDDLAGDLGILFQDDGTQFVPLDEYVLPPYVPPDEQINLTFDDDAVIDPVGEENFTAGTRSGAEGTKLASKDHTRDVNVKDPTTPEKDQCIAEHENVPKAEGQSEAGNEAEKGIEGVKQTKDTIEDDRRSAPVTAEKHANAKNQKKESPINADGKSEDVNGDQQASSRDQQTRLASIGDVGSQPTPQTKLAQPTLAPNIDSGHDDLDYDENTEDYPPSGSGQSYQQGESANGGGDASGGDEGSDDGDDDNEKDRKKDQSKEDDEDENADEDDEEDNESEESEATLSTVTGRLDDENPDDPKDEDYIDEESSERSTTASIYSDRDSTTDSNDSQMDAKIKKAEEDAGIAKTGEESGRSRKSGNDRNASKPRESSFQRSQTRSSGSRSGPKPASNVPSSSSVSSLGGGSHPATVDDVRRPDADGTSSRLTKNSKQASNVPSSSSVSSLGGGSQKATVDDVRRPDADGTSSRLTKNSKQADSKREDRSRRDERKLSATDKERGRRRSRSRSRQKSSANREQHGTAASKEERHDDERKSGRPDLKRKASETSTRASYDRRRRRSISPARSPARRGRRSPYRSPPRRRRRLSSDQSSRERHHCSATRSSGHSRSRTPHRSSAYSNRYSSTRRSESHRNGTKKRRSKSPQSKRGVIIRSGMEPRSEEISAKASSKDKGSSGTVQASARSDERGADSRGQRKRSRSPAAAENPKKDPNPQKKLVAKDKLKASSKGGKFDYLVKDRLPNSGASSGRQESNLIDLTKDNSNEEETINSTKRDVLLEAMESAGIPLNGTLPQPSVPGKPSSDPAKPPPSAPVKPLPSAPVKPPPSAQVKPASAPVKPPSAPVKPPPSAAVKPTPADPVTLPPSALEKPSPSAPLKPPQSAPVKPPSVPLAPPMSAPVKPLSDPVKPLPAPTQTPSDPVKPPQVPVQSPADPVKPPPAPIHTPSAQIMPPTAPIMPPTAPIMPPTAPIMPPTAPIRPPTAPIRPPTSPIHPPQAPIRPPQASIRPPTAPIRPPTAPIRPPTSPIHPPQAPIHPTQAQFPAQPRLPAQPCLPAQPRIPLQPRIPAQPCLPTQPRVPLQPRLPAQHNSSVKHTVSEAQHVPAPQSDELPQPILQTLSVNMTGPVTPQDDTASQQNLIKGEHLRFVTEVEVVSTETPVDLHINQEPESNEPELEEVHGVASSIRENAALLSILNDFSLDPYEVLDFESELRNINVAGGMSGIDDPLMMDTTSVMFRQTDSSEALFGMISELSGRDRKLIDEAKLAQRANEQSANENEGVGSGNPMDTSQNESEMAKSNITGSGATNTLSEHCNKPTETCGAEGSEASGNNTRVLNSNESEAVTGQTSADEPEVEGNIEEQNENGGLKSITGKSSTDGTEPVLVLRAATTSSAVAQSLDSQETIRKCLAMHMNVQTPDGELPSMEELKQVMAAPSCSDRVKNALLSTLDTTQILITNYIQAVSSGRNNREKDEQELRRLKDVRDKLRQQNEELLREIAELKKGYNELEKNSEKKLQAVQDQLKKALAEGDEASKATKEIKDLQGKVQSMDAEKQQLLKKLERLEAINADQARRLQQQRSAHGASLQTSQESPKGTSQVPAKQTLSTSQAGEIKPKASAKQSGGRPPAKTSTTETPKRQKQNAKKPTQAQVEKKVHQKGGSSTGQTEKVGSQLGLPTPEQYRKKLQALKKEQKSSTSMSPKNADVQLLEQAIGVPSAAGTANQTEMSKLRSEPQATSSIRGKASKLFDPFKTPLPTAQRPPNPTKKTKPTAERTKGSLSSGSATLVAKEKEKKASIEAASGSKKAKGVSGAAKSAENQPASSGPAQGSSTHQPHYRLMEPGPPNLQPQQYVPVVTPGVPGVGAPPGVPGAGAPNVQATYGTTYYPQARPPVACMGPSIYAPTASSNQPMAAPFGSRPVFNPMYQAQMQQQQPFAQGLPPGNYQPSAIRPQNLQMQMPGGGVRYGVPMQTPVTSNVMPPQRTPQVQAPAGTSAVGNPPTSGNV